MPKKKLNPEEYGEIKEFWRLLQKEIDELPKKTAERRETQWGSDLNGEKDKIAFKIKPNFLQVYIRAGEEIKRGGDQEKLTLRGQKMKIYSRVVRNSLSKQELKYNLGKKNPKKEHSEGRSIRIQLAWSRCEKDKWDKAVKWGKQWYNRLRPIIFEE